MIEHPFIAQARQAVGVAHVLTQDLAPYAVDWKDKYHGRPLAVVRPGNTDDQCAVAPLRSRHPRSIAPTGRKTV